MDADRPGAAGLAGGQAGQAAAHDFHLLIKPVLPAKPRAMIGLEFGIR